MNKLLGFGLVLLSVLLVCGCMGLGAPPAPQQEVTPPAQEAAPSAPAETPAPATTGISPAEITNSNFLEVVQSGQAFDCDIKAGDLVWSYVKGKDGKVRLETTYTDSFDSRITIADSATKKTYTRYLLPSITYAGCEWVVLENTEDPDPTGMTVNYDKFMEGLQSLPTNTQLTLACREPSFSDEVLAPNAGVCTYAERMVLQHEDMCKEYTGDTYDACIDSLAEKGCFSPTFDCSTMIETN